MSWVIPENYDYSFPSKALLIAKVPFDATGKNVVEGFTITGNEPTGTNRRFLFKVDGSLIKFVDGVPTVFTGNLDVDTVLEAGNTAAELTALENITAFVGKKIYPIIALYAPNDSPVFPSAKIGLRVRADIDVYQNVVESAEYDLAATDDSTPRISSISATTVLTGNGSVDILVRLRDAEGNWSAYMPLNEAQNAEATAVQFKMTFNVLTLDGSDSAKVTSITINHNMGATAVSGNVAELYSVVQGYEVDLQTCYVVVRHKKLADSTIQAYVNYMQPPKHRERIAIGVADGTFQQLPLGLDGEKDSGIDQNTLKIFADGEPLADFGYNVEVSEVTVTLPQGTAVTASYDYGRDSEIWLPMEQIIDSQPYLDDEQTYMTRFNFALDEDDTADKQISNIRLQLVRSDGRVEDESLGDATGLIQQIVLPHAAKQSSIELNADWSYNADSHVLTFVADKNTPLVLSYDYLGEQQEILSWAVGWTAAV